MKKGQMFIIAMIFMIAVIVLVKNMASTLELTEDIRFQQAKVSEQNMKNYVNEFRKVAAASAAQDSANESGLLWLSDFSGRLYDYEGARILFIFITANSSTSKYSVAIGNYLGDDINISYNVTNSTPGGYSQVIGNMQTSAISHAAAISGALIFNATYNIGGIETSERFEFKSGPKNEVALFTDATAISEDFSARGKDVYIWEWPS